MLSATLRTFASFAVLCVSLGTPPKLLNEINNLRGWVSRSHSPDKTGMVTLREPWFEVLQDRKTGSRKEAKFTQRSLRVLRNDLAGPYSSRRSSKSIRGLNSIPLLTRLPILFQHQLVYPVGVKHLMHQHVPEHYVDRVVAERLIARPSAANPLGIAPSTAQRPAPAPARNGPALRPDQHSVMSRPPLPVMVR